MEISHERYLDQVCGGGDGLANPWAVPSARALKGTRAGLNNA